jgi:hypothetical protein
VVIPLSGRVQVRASGPSRSQVDDGGRSRCVSRKLIGSLGFSRREEYIGGRVASGGGPGGLTTRGAGQGLAAPPYGVAGPWPPFVSSSVFWKLR